MLNYLQVSDTFCPRESDKQSENQVKKKEKEDKTEWDREIENGLSWNFVKFFENVGKLVQFILNWSYPVK